MQELHRQGFKARYGDSNSRHIYSRMGLAGLFCEKEWIVSWAPTSDGGVRGVAGTFDVTCP